MDLFLSLEFFPRWWLSPSGGEEVFQPFDFWRSSKLFFSKGEATGEEETPAEISDPPPSIAIPCGRFFPTSRKRRSGPPSSSADFF